jgi:hypothetical protein
MRKIEFGILIALALALTTTISWAQLPLPPAPPGHPPGFPAPFPRSHIQPVPEQQTPPLATRPQPAPQQQAPNPGSQALQPVPQQQQAQPGGQPLEYAFRPNLTNPEFGMCLKLEKNWKALWNTYYQLYSQLRMMNPNDPRYAQMVRYAYGVKAQLDAAWQNFSSRCIYFPRH